MSTTPLSLILDALALFRRHVLQAEIMADESLVDLLWPVDERSITGYMYRPTDAETRGQYQLLPTGDADSLADEVASPIPNEEADFSADESTPLLLRMKEE